MLEIHLIGFGNQTENKRFEITRWIKKQLAKTPTHQILLYTRVKNETIVVGHPQSTSHSLLAHAASPFIVIQSTNLEEIGFLADLLMDMPKRPDIVKGAVLTGFIPDK
jgi:hypothetical protein